MIRLIYVSTATHEMNEEELLALLEQSRKKNADKGLSGMLLYAGGNFFQILEGEKETVEELYHVILKDERHRDCTLIDESEITERTFKEWSMGFRHLTLADSSQIEGFSDFLRRKMKPEEFCHHKDATVDLLYHFKKNI